VSNAVQPPILNLKGKKNSARPQHPPYFRKSAILQLVRTQMMKHENGNRRSKRVIRKRQSCRIALKYAGICSAYASTESRGKFVVVF
jgi:hypothetical protein